MRVLTRSLAAAAAACSLAGAMALSGCETAPPWVPPGPYGGCPPGYHPGPNGGRLLAERWPSAAAVDSTRALRRLPALDIIQARTAALLAKREALPPPRSTGAWRRVSARAITWGRTGPLLA